MKKFLSKPGFEFIFSLSLIVILGLPPVLLAQNQKDVEIKIENGDTTVNGKNIKTLSPADRQNALKDINHLNGQVSITVFKGGDGDKHMYLFKRRDTLGNKGNRVGFWNNGTENGEHQRMVTENIVIRDSLGNIVEVKPGKTPKGMRFRERDFDRPFTSPMMRFDRRNTQNFDYVNTDNEGISTRVSYHVSEASNDDLKRMPHVEGGKFEIENLNLVPEFTSGKTLLMFNLPSKAVAEVKLHDSEGRLLWSEKSVNGNFSKTFTLGLNGIYYLQIKQGNSIAIKRIVKEE